MIPWMTWKGDAIVYMNRDYIKKVVTETSVLGPIAAMYGRELQQFLITKQDKTAITVTQMQHSVNSGRASLNRKALAELRQEAITNMSTRSATNSDAEQARSSSHAQSSQHKAPWREPPRRDSRRAPYPPQRQDDHISQEHKPRHTDIRYSSESVSYTHLTLPTICSV